MLALLTLLTLLLSTALNKAPVCETLPVCQHVRIELQDYVLTAL